MRVLDTDGNECPMSIKSNMELGFIGRNKINDVIDPDEHKVIIKDHEISQSDGCQKCYTFEEAIKVTGHGKFHYVVLLATGISLMALVAELIGIGYSAPSAKCDMKFTTSQQGVLNSIAFFGFVCSSHLWGFLSDTWGRHKSLRLALMSTFVFSALSSISVSIAMLITTRFFVGFCIAGIQASALPYLGEFHSNQTRARAITFASMCMTLAVLLMSLISWAIIPMKWSFSLGFIVYTPWRFNIICCGLISLLAFIILSFLPESPKFLLSLGKEEMAIDVLKRIHRSNNRTKRTMVGINWNEFSRYQLQKCFEINLEPNVAPIRPTSFEKYVVNFIFVISFVWNCTRHEYVKATINESLKHDVSFVFREGQLLPAPCESCPLHVDIPPAKMVHYMVVCFWYIFMWNLTFAWGRLPHIYNVLIDHIDDSLTMCDVILSTMGKTSPSTVEPGSNASTSVTLECSNVANPLTFKMMVIFGIYLILVYVAVGIFIKWITIKTITTVGLLASTICGASLIWSYNFYLSYLFLCILLSCGNFASLLGGLCQDLFPTNLKAMAVCFIFMFGRIGSVVGSNLIGLLITTNCTLILIIYVVILSSCALLCQLFLKTPNSK